MKLLGYVRVSTKGQADNFSIEDQINKIKAFCNIYNHEVEIYQDTFSGKNLNRKELTVLFSKLNEVDGIIVYKLDRLSRSAKDTLEVVDQLEALNKNLISVSEQFDFSTPQGKLMLTVLSGFSEFERNLIKERVTNGRKAKKATGSYAGGQPKLGYKVKHTVIGENNGKIITKKLLIADPKEQEIIKIIRNHRRSGKSNSSIAKYLNDNGYKTKQGKTFTDVQVKRVLEK